MALDQMDAVAICTAYVQQHTCPRTAQPEYWRQPRGLQNPTSKQDGSFDSHDEKGTNYPREDGSGKPLPAPSSHGNTLLRAQSIQPWQHADSHPPTTGVCRSWKLLCKEVTQENKGQTGGRLLIQKYFLLDSPLPAVPLCFEAWWIPPSQHPSPARSTGTAEETRFLEISTGAWSCCTPAAPSAGSIAEQARGEPGAGHPSASASCTFSEISEVFQAFFE
ncbi:uncharacterized protein LJ206_010465 isoform 2-T2 [Theristicus caerulescens]